MIINKVNGGVRFSLLLIFGILFYAILLYAQSPAREPKQGGHECSSPQPCTELKLPPDIATKSTGWVSTTQGDLHALNLGYQVNLSWKGQPSSTKRILVYRAKFGTGPWKKVIDIPATALGTNPSVSSVPDIQVDGTVSDLYYRVEAVDSEGTILRTYGKLRVPKYGNR